MPALFEGARKSMGFVLGFVALSVVVWLAEFAYQFYALIPGELAGSILRGSALAGATFISAALFSSALFKWVPRWGKYWYVRRSLGVVGTVFILVHVLVVMNSLFQWDVGGLFWSWNPIENPIIFGLMAVPIFVAMMLTSTDWAYEKMGFPRWKALHRLVYLGYLFAVLHFITIKPDLLMNPAGYALIGLTFLALSGEIFWFVKISWAKRFKSLGSVLGIALVFVWLLIIYMGLVAPYLIESKAGKTESLGASSLPLDQAVEKMKDFMKDNPGDSPTEPAASDSGFSGERKRSGVFQNLNYMTSGSASIEEKDGKSFLVFGDDFSTPNGPDLVVYLTGNSAPSTREDVSTGLEIGELKSTSGKQVYEIPAVADAGGFGSVTIHCRAFNVPWSYAPLV